MDHQQAYVAVSDWGNFIRLVDDERAIWMHVFEQHAKLWTKFCEGKNFHDLLVVIFVAVTKLLGGFLKYIFIYSYVYHPILVKFFSSYISICTILIWNICDFVYIRCF